MLFKDSRERTIKRRAQNFLDGPGAAHMALIDPNR
jgi:hypothetical protein